MRLHLHIRTHAGSDDDIYMYVEDTGMYVHNGLANPVDSDDGP
jgi:hypothetical protein